MKEQQIDNGFYSENLRMVAQNLSSILMESESIDLESILSKICVSRPYFAFEKIYKYKNLLIAPISREQQLMNEVGQMSVGEICRHMAILGTCAAALDQSEKYYYLAREGVTNLIQRNVTQQNASLDQLLYAVMSCDSIERRSAHSSGVLINQNQEIIFDVKVSYEKIADKLFKKFFGDHFQKTEVTNYNPYKGIIKFEDVKVKGNVLTATMPEISIQHCAGHFYGCPAIPIAFAAYNVTRYAGELFFSKTGIKNYIISKANLLSSHLPFPTQRNEIEIRYDGRTNDEYNFSCGHWVGG